MIPLLVAALLLDVPIVRTHDGFVGAALPVCLASPDGSCNDNIVLGFAGWRAAATSSIAVLSVYQTLFAAGTAQHGGTVVNTSPPGTAPIWVDVTSAVGATMSTAAVPIYPAAMPGYAPGTWRFPGASGAVTIYGPAGATFQAFGG